MPVAAFLAGVVPGPEAPPGGTQLREAHPREHYESALPLVAGGEKTVRRTASRVSAAAGRVWTALKAVPSALRPDAGLAWGGPGRASPGDAQVDPAEPDPAEPDTAAGPGSPGTAAAGSAGPSALRAAAATALKSRYRIKSAEELAVEEEIESVFRQYFKDYTLAGQSITVRMPFGLNGEREGSRGFFQSFYQGGKGTPEEIWAHVDTLFASLQFGKYVEDLGGPAPKVLVFDLEQRSWRVTREAELLASLGGGPGTGGYPGTPTRIFVYRHDSGVRPADLYNYLYAVAAVGIDCSGLVHHVHRAIAGQRGLDLDRELARVLRTRPSLVRYRIGLWFYDPAAGFTEPIPDRIEDLRPADLLLFEGSDGSFKHSAVIQSIDFETGLIRYVQSTDWAPQGERGVHESIIRFDPARPDVDLHHYSVRWLQQVRPPFEGETEPRDWVDDGDRYLWYLDAGGSRAVRLKSLAALLSEREPLFYTNVYRGDRAPAEAPAGAAEDAPAQTSADTSR
jgi:hypothetical protein